jgi:AmiR/NasT family two-component response regulator
MPNDGVVENGRPSASQSTVEVSSLLEVMASRDVISRAKGMLMERYKIGGDEGFERLRRASKRLNRKVLDLAIEVDAGGELA